MRNGSTPSLDLNLNLFPDNHQPQIEQIKFTFVFTLACICYSGPKGFKNKYFAISNIRREKISTGTRWCACHFGSYPPTYKSGNKVYLQGDFISFVDEYMISDYIWTRWKAETPISVDIFISADLFFVFLSFHPDTCQRWCFHICRLCKACLSAKFSHLSSARKNFQLFSVNYFQAILWLFEKSNCWTVYSMPTLWLLGKRIAK